MSHTPKQNTNKQPPPKKPQHFTHVFYRQGTMVNCSCHSEETQSSKVRGWAGCGCGQEGRGSNDLWLVHTHMQCSPELLATTDALTVRNGPLEQNQASSHRRWERNSAEGDPSFPTVRCLCCHPYSLPSSLYSHAALNVRIWCTTCMSMSFMPQYIYTVRFISCSLFFEFVVTKLFSSFSYWLFHNCLSHWLIVNSCNDRLNSWINEMNEAEMENKLSDVMIYHCLSSCKRSINQQKHTTND